jgi:Bacterial regulatory protein, Fis family
MAETQDTAERARIVAALEACDYVIARAADVLGVSKTTLKRRIPAHGLDGWLEERSRRVRRLRETLEGRGLPRAPHERSRQAEDQESNRAAGLCSCGKPPDPLKDGSPGRMCNGCRKREKIKKRRTGRTYADDRPYRPDFPIGAPKKKSRAA